MLKSENNKILVLFCLKKKISQIFLKTTDIINDFVNDLVEF